MAISRTEFVVSGHKETLNSLLEQIRALEDLNRAGKQNEAQTAANRAKIIELRRAMQDTRREFTDTSQRASALAGQFGIVLPQAMQKTILQSQRARNVVNGLFNVSQVALFAGAIGAALVPAIGLLIEHFTRAREEAEKISAAIDAAVSKLKSLDVTRDLQAAESILDVLQRRAEAIRQRRIEIDVGRSARGRAGFGAEEAALLAAENAAILKNIELAQKTVAQLEKQLPPIELLKRSVGALNPQLAELVKSLDPDLARATEKATKELEKMRQVADQLGDKSIEDARKELAALSNLEIQHAENVAASVDSARKELDAPNKKEIEEFLGHAEEVSRSVETATSELEKMKQAGVDAFERWQQSVQSLGFELRNLADSPLEYLKNRFKQAMFEMVAASLLGAQGIGRNVMSFLFPGTFGGGFGSPLPGVGFGGARAPGGTGTFTGAPIQGVSSSTASAMGLGPVDPLTGTPLSAGVGVSSGAALPAGSATGALAQAGGLSALFRNPAFAAVGLPMLLSGLIPGSGRFSSGLRGALTGFGLGAGGALAAGALLGGAGGGLGFFAGSLAAAFPIVGAIAAGVGLLFGLFGGPNWGKRRDRFLRDQFTPQVERVIDAYKMHQMDYGSAISQLESLRQSGVDQLRQLKGDGSRAHQIIDQAIENINQTEAARLLASQRISGLPIPEFGSGGLVTGALGRPVPILAHAGEAVLNLQQQAMVGPERIRAAFRTTGASERPRAGSFDAGGVVAGGGETYNITIQALDGADIERVIMRNEVGFVRSIRRISRAYTGRVPF